MAMAKEIPRDSATSSTLVYHHINKSMMTSMIVLVGRLVVRRRVVLGIGRNSSQGCPIGTRDALHVMPLVTLCGIFFPLQCMAKHTQHALPVNIDRVSRFIQYSINLPRLKPLWRSFLHLQWMNAGVSRHMDGHRLHRSATFGTRERR